MTTAVCYVASGTGYLFPTVVSAAQARRQCAPDVAVVVVHLVTPGADPAEAAACGAAARDEGVTFVEAGVEVLGGLRPIYGRLCLPDLLDDDVNQLLYLDGDTQVVADLGPLLAADPGEGLLAARDPMVFVRQIAPALGRQIDGWWDESAIPGPDRESYANTGVMRVGRATLSRVRDAIVSQSPEVLNHLHFLDQDAINLVLSGEVRPVSMAWNFPGFLVGSPLAQEVSPRIVHFMSDPRPWNASLPPWGRGFHQAYLDYVARHPATGPYRTSFSRARRLRYQVQQRVKAVTEGRIWNSAAARDAVRALEQRVALT